jgi:hypothetical protein
MHIVPTRTAQGYRDSIIQRVAYFGRYNDYEGLCAYRISTDFRTALERCESDEFRDQAFEAYDRARAKCRPKRGRSVPVIKKKGGCVVWDASMINALKNEAKLSASNRELARRLDLPIATVTTARSRYKVSLGRAEPRRATHGSNLSLAA